MKTPPRPPLVAPPRRPGAKPGVDNQRLFINRARGFGILIVVLFLALVARLWFLQVAHGDDFRDDAAANQSRRIRTRAARGAIVDRNGTLLAANRPRFAVYATPDVVKHPEIVQRLAMLLHETPAELKSVIAAGAQNPYDPLRVALDVPMDTVTKVEENRPFMPGISTAPEPVRWYPRSDLAAHVLGTMGRINANEWKTKRTQGYFSDDFLGKTGIERQYESYLRGTPGGVDVQIDARGQRVRTLDTTPALPGDTVTLALDAGVQAAGQDAMRQNHFIGAAVALDPRTGAVIAMVSNPGYDPNKFATSISVADWKHLNTDPAHPLINRAVDAMYPPGSTFKPIVAAAGLQTGAMTPNSTVYCPGYYMLGKARFGDWEVHGAVNFDSAIAQSCDVFFYTYGRKIGPDKIAEYAKDFGFAEKTGIDLPSEDIGAIPSPAWKEKHYRRSPPDLRKWYGGDTLHMSIGQGDVLTTPLQLARATAALANGGDVLRPYIVSKIVNPSSGKTVFENSRKVVRHVPVSPANIEAIRHAMRQTVTSGTGRIVDFKEVPAAAKTGSAQVHGSSATHGLFICFAPYDHPTIAIAAIVEHGGHGANTAGKVARAMLVKYFHLGHEAERTARGD